MIGKGGAVALPVSCPCVVPLALAGIFTIEAPPHTHTHTCASIRNAVNLLGYFKAVSRQQDVDDVSLLPYMCGTSSDAFKAVASCNPHGSSLCHVTRQGVVSVGMRVSGTSTA